MSCSLNDIKNDSMAVVRNLIKGNATTVSFTKKGDALITPSSNSKKVNTQAKALRMAEAKVRQIDNWSKEKFGTDAYTGQWTSISQSPSDVRIQLTFPKSLEKLYEKKIAIDQARELQEQDAERAGVLYSDDYLFDELPQSQDGFQYGLYLDKKRNIRDYFSTRISVLENMSNKSKSDFEQISEYKEVVKKLNKDINALEDENAVLENFFNYFNNDLKIIKDILLNNKTMDNLLSARNLVDEMAFITGFDPENNTRENPAYFSDSDFHELNSEQKKLFDEFAAELNSIDIQLTNAETTFLNEGLQNELTDDSEQQAEQISWFAKNFLPIDGSSDSSPIMKYVRKTYDDAVGKSETYTLRQSLQSIKDNLNQVLKNNNDTFDIFKRKDDNGNLRIASKYNNTWNEFSNIINKKFNDIRELTYKKNKDVEDYQKIRSERTKLFDSMNGNVEFIDVRRIPELLNNQELKGSFSNFFLEQQEADNYKEELITLIMGESSNRKAAEKIYDNIVNEQLDNLHSFQVDMNRYLQRLLKEENIDNFNELSDKSKNFYYEVYYTNSPFAFADSYNNTGTSTVKKMFLNNNNQNLTNDIATLEYQTIIPKNNEFIDKDFESKIESNEEYFEAWNMLDTATRYINKNRKYKARYGEVIKQDALLYEQDLYKQNVDSILSLGKHYSKLVIDRIKDTLSTSKYKDENNVVLGSGVTSIEERVNNSLRLKQKVVTKLGLNLTDAVTKSGLSEKTIEYFNSITDIPIPKNFIVNEYLEKIARNEILSGQTEDMIDSLSGQLEVVEKFKAKKEIETKLLFLKNLIERESKEIDPKKRDNNVRSVIDFINANLYNINNRANWGIKNPLRTNKDAGTQLFKYAEEETIKEIDNSINFIKEIIKESNDQNLIEEAQADIDALIAYKNSKGKIISPGSITETITIKIPILAGLGLNIPSQIGNLFMGNLAGRQNDGLEWTNGNFIAADSYTRKWKIARRKLSKKERSNHKLTNTLIDGLGVFQNSANEIHKVKESNIKNSALKYATNPLHIVGDMEKNIQRPQILSKLADVTVEGNNGELVPVFNSKNLSDPHPAFTLNNGVLKLKPEFDNEKNRNTWINRNSQEYANLFGESGEIPKMIARINGDYRESSNMGIKNSTLGAMFMMFKTWMPAFIQRRYGRKDGVVTGLFNSGRTSETVMLQAMTASSYFLSGATIYLSPLFTVMGTAAYMGYRTFKKSQQDDVNYLKALTDEIKNTKLKLSYIKTPFQLAAGIAGKFAQQSTNLLTGKQLISNDAVAKLSGIKQKEEESDSDFEMNKARLNFLLTEASTTLTLLMLKGLVNATLFPDEEEEKKYKELNGFYDKIKNDPDSTLYYFAENMLSRFSNDVNLLNDGLSMLSSLQLGTVDKITGILDAVYYQAVDGDYTRGPNKGKNRIWTKTSQFFIPRGMTDFSLGFGKTVREDYKKKDLVNRVFMSDLDKYENERQKQRSERKIELEKEYENRYKNKSKDYINKKIQKKLLNEFPTIKKYFNEDGTLKPNKSNKIERYN